MQSHLQLSPEQQDVEHRLTKLSIRDAKGLSAELKETLKKRDINDRQLQLQTQTLRQAYLDLIFSPALASSAPPNGSPTAVAKQSSSALLRRLELLNLLWLDTSHAIIQVFRAKVSTMDKVIAEAPRAHRNGSAGGGGGGGGRGGPSVPGPAARRKLIQAFRQFLTGEEDFFRALIGRLAAGGLAKGDVEGLRSLGVVVDLVDPATGVEWDWTEQERRSRREMAIPLAHKALICFGDLARYKELYNEPGASPPNPLVGAGGGKRPDSRGRRGGRGGAQQKVESSERKVKNYSKAADCYRQARLLIPENGNPSNQLAVLSQYSNDSLASTYHYYRALAVKQPFVTARTNLDITYTKQLAKWIERDEDAFERDEAERFRGAFVALQAVFFKAKVEGATSLTAQVEQLLKNAIEERLLLSDVVAKVVVTAICSLWNARVLRSAPADNKSDRKSKSASPSSFAAIEPFILLHVLSLYRVLLDAGAAETTELVNQNAQNDTEEEQQDGFAQNISAVLRRISPALRILSKWLNSQLEYIQRAQARLQAREQKDSSGSLSSVEFAAEIDRFWRAYAAFGSTMRAAFPLEKLPTDEGVWLEEDVELLGFAPLKKGMKELASSVDGRTLEIARVGTDVHPNDEQLMRIADIQRDALLIASSELAAINSTEDGFVCTATAVKNRPVPPPAPVALPTLVRARAPAVPTMPSDDGEEGYQFTEDDPVDLAMRISAADRMQMELNGADEDENEDEKAYAMMSSSSQLLKPGSASASALLPPSAPSAQPQNVAELLLQVLQGSKTPSAGTPVGSSPPIGPSRSIWAPTEARQGPPPPAPITRDSFEALPNTTTNLGHNSPQYHGASASWGQTAHHAPSPLGYNSIQQPQHYAQQYSQYQQPQHQPYSAYSRPSNAYSAPAPAPGPAQASTTSFFGGAFSPFSPQQAPQQLPPSAPASWNFQPNPTVTSVAGPAQAYAAYAAGGGYSHQPYAPTSAAPQGSNGYTYQGFG